jgi:MFS family permease
LPTSVVLWALIATLQGQLLYKLCLVVSPHMYLTSISPGFVTSYAGLVTVRAFLGVAEGPLGPGTLLYLSDFYIRKELSFSYVLDNYFSGVTSTILTLIKNRHNFLVNYGAL